MTKQAAQATRERVALIGRDGNPADVDFGTLDPYIDPCPAWCENAAAGHEVESADADRMHYGHTYVVPVRSIRFAMPAGSLGTYVVGALSLFVQRNTRHRESTIRLGKTLGGKGFTFTLDEAETIARTMLEIVETAR